MDEKEVLNANDYITRPFTEDNEELPMCLATYLNNNYIGGFGGFDDQGRAILVDPLIYREIPDPRKQQIATIFDSVFKFNPLIEIFMIKADGFYILKSYEEGDKKLVTAYEDTINGFRAAEAGIVVPDNVKDFSNYKS